MRWSLFEWTARRANYPPVSCSRAYIPHRSLFTGISSRFLHLRVNQAQEEPSPPLLAPISRESSETSAALCAPLFNLCALTIRAPRINLIFYFANERSVSYDGELLESACTRDWPSLFRRVFLMNPLSRCLLFLRSCVFYRYPVSRSFRSQAHVPAALAESSSFLSDARSSDLKSFHLFPIWDGFFGEVYK